MDLWSELCSTGLLNIGHSLQIGEPLSEELTMDEIRSHFALWAIAKSPLFISADLRYDVLRGLGPFHCVNSYPCPRDSLSQGRHSSETHLYDQWKSKDGTFVKQLMHVLV